MRFRIMVAQIGCAVVMCAWIAIAGSGDRPGVVNANWSLASEWYPDKISERVFSRDVRPNWIGSTDRFWYRFESSSGIRYWIVDPREPSKLPLFDHGRLAVMISEATGTRQEPERLDLGAVEVDPTDLSVRFTVGEQRFELVPGGASLKPIEADPAPPEWCTPSPDGSTCVFARGHDLYSRSLGGDETIEVRLTHDGVRGWGWGDPWELIDDADQTARSAHVVWSPDSRFVAIQRSDSREVADLWNVDFLAQPRPTLTTFKYPMPGEAVPQWQVWVVRVADGRASQVDVARWPDQTMEEFFVRPLWWSDDSSTLYFFRRSRDYRMLDLCAADPMTGESRTLVEERLDGMVYARPWVELSDGRFLWWSIHDGWGHYGLYAADGALERVLTRGDFNVEDVAAVDEGAGSAFLVANGREQGRNPYYDHLYRVDLERPGLQLLTPEDADHSVVFSPSKRVFVDRVSRVDQPTRSLVRNANGTHVIDLETADTSALEAAGWKPPEIFKALAADGLTELWGVVWKPFDFDPKMKYSIITSVYPGKMDEYIPKRFQPVDVETALSQLGSIVVRFGNRGGSRVRGFAYREYGRAQFRDYGLADKRAVIEELAARFDFIDAARVGIYGSSSGGFMTVSAMLVHPDVFKVGVAMNGPHDPLIQSAEWVERYAGVTRVMDDGGSAHWRPAEVASNLELADKLEGRLLLIHGTQDEIVPLAQHMRMVDAFVKADKRVDQFIIPGAAHRLPWRPAYGLVWRYFAEHLIED